MIREKELDVELEDARAALQRVKDEIIDRAPRPVEEATITALTEKIGSLEHERRFEREQLERNRNGAPAVRTAEGELPAAVLRQRTGGPGPGGRTFAELFGPPKASPFKAPGDFFAALHAGATTGMWDPTLKPLASMGESVGSEGGFAVPEPIIAGWLDTGLESEVVRPRATVYPMQTDMINLPGWDDNTHAAGLIAGFRSYWTAELGALTESSGKLRKIQMHAEKLAMLTQISNELLADGGQSFRDQLDRKMGQAVSWNLDYKFLTGTGAGQPLGIVSDPALVVVAKETVPAQAAATVLLPNVLKMYARLYAGGHRNAVWICNYNVVPQLYAMQNKVLNQAGTEWVGGSATGYFNVGANGSMTLLGLPVIPTEKLPTLGQQGDIVLADLSQYVIGLRADIRVDASNGPGFATDSTYVRCIVRVNGCGSWNAPLTPKTGDTLSWVVALAIRS